jgi:hypothetical protein
MTETAAAYTGLPTPANLSEEIIDFTLALQGYLADDPDPRATTLLAIAIEIMDDLLETFPAPPIS